MVTIEFYSDPLLIQMIGAVYVEKKRCQEHAQTMGKTLWRKQEDISMRMSCR